MTVGQVQKLELYYATGACSLVPHVALEEAGAAFQATRVDLASGEQRSEAYRLINPLGRVPALAVDGEVISENIAILTYIAHQFPESGVLPLQWPLALGRAYELMSWLASTAHVTIAQIWRTERFTDDAEAAVALQRDGRVHVAAHFATIEQKIAGEWVLGHRFSVLDPYLLVFWRWGERLGMDMSAYPRWADLVQRTKARPTVARVLERETLAQETAGR